MQTVSTFLDELAKRAGGADELRALISKAAKRKPIFSQPTIPMWKRRGIPWPLHPVMHKVCEQLGVPADPRVWRNTKSPKPPIPQESKRDTTMVDA